MCPLPLSKPLLRGNPPVALRCRIDVARKALNVSSDAEFARQLGVSRGTISLPDTVMCANLAGLTGLPLTRVLGIVDEARAVSREEKAVWRKLAATAAGLLRQL
ncbi:hypothetical protein D3C81_1109680 [compost metagenome]